MSAVGRLIVPSIAATAFFAFGWWMAWMLISGRVENCWGYVFLSMATAACFACATVNAAWDHRP